MLEHLSAYERTQWNVKELFGSQLKISTYIMFRKLNWSSVILTSIIKHLLCRDLLSPVDPNS